jgi:recombination associated protein RdgC
MWFKNIQVYRFTKPFTLTAEQIHEQLAEQGFQACGSQDRSKIGWVPPLGENTSEYVHVANGYILVCCKKQDKVLPAAAVNEVLEEKVSDIQEEEGRKVGRKERMQLKDDILISMLPRAFTRSSKHYAYFSPAEGTLIVNTASANRADELVSSLREALGSLPVIPAISRNIPQQVMSSWLKQGRVDQDLELGHECELRDPSDEGGIIRCTHQELGSKHILNHIEEGMYVSKVGLCSSAGIECVIDEKLAIKRLVYGDMIQEKVQQVDAQDAAEQFDVDFSIMTLELSAFLKQLFRAFGGEDLSACEDSTVVDQPAAAGAELLAEA